MKPTNDNIDVFRRTLLSWWQGNARDFPWRHNRTPYRTAIAELMLRRTRAEQVVPVYNAYMEANPTLEDASQSAIDTTEALLYPLGLRWRAQNMTDFVRDARSRYGSDLPTSIDELKSLPGVGEYVSAAIACFAGDQSVALIDTNVARLLGRVFGLPVTGEARRRADVKRLAERCVPDLNPGEYHYAILDFGALICTARRPKCTSCPIAQYCNFAAKG